MKKNNSDTGLGKGTGILCFAWSAAMLMYVPCVALCVNPPLLAGRMFLILAAWYVLWMLPYLFFPRKFCYRLAVAVLFAGSLLNLAHWLVLKSPLNLSSLFVLLNTNGSEAVEFVSLKASLRWLLLLPYLFLALQAFRRVPAVYFGKMGEKGSISLSENGGIQTQAVPSPLFGRWLLRIALLLFVSLFYGEAAWNGRLVRTALPDTERTLCSFSKEMKAYRSLKQRKFRPVEAHTDKAPCVSVLIVGESCNRNHMSLYGYHRPTSPKLSCRDDILCFTNVITPYSSTLNALLGSLTESNMDFPVSSDSCIHALDIYRSAGFTTYWISNQSPLGVWDNAVFNFAKVADHPLFVNRAANSSFESTQMAVYDGGLLPVLHRVLADDTVSRKWIVLHLMGSHSQYDKRYPAAYAIYRDGVDKRQRTIDAYDNSILYNDAVVDSIFTMLALYAANHPQTRVHALYLSDHGENVYDAGETAGHDYADTIPYANVEIPFVLWLSVQDTLCDTSFFHRVRSRLSWPFMTDDLFHLLLDLDGISTPYFKPERSLFNSAYFKERPRLLMDGREYLPSTFSAPHHPTAQ